MRAVICGNTETIVDSYVDDTVDHETRERAAEAYVDAAWGILEAAGYEVNIAHHYHDWHGGRYSSHQTWKSGNRPCGCVVVREEDDFAVAWAADSAGVDAMFQVLYPE